ncbi:fimbria/pilus periplasmic chaperone [Enterobacter dykesii]|uniref:fimbrial biogenesis chaperone n=1 Tax=Enterobacter dykesii TaxID=2797506 RepID=UPI001BE02F55|nr:fimbria/pilus periplasmic chaperone [Enterobacter dykesii]MBT1713640.1 fimbria/pilus periplasmic chaperone [Enterobacter dykesii]
MKTCFQFAIAGALILSAISTAQAGVVVGGTRVIYDASKKEATLSVKNPDSVPYLIQSWIENPDKSPAKVPFIITPPLYRLDQGQKNVMRIVLSGELPEDKESMYWLNVKSIPSSEKKANTLQIALKTRLKLIYRPQALKVHSAEEMADKLIWKRSGNRLLITNPTAYYMNFNEITVGGKSVSDVTYAAPGQTASFDLPENINAGRITFKIINDFGGLGTSHSATL